MRIAINGMGRIGRLLFRRLAGDPLLNVVAVNDIMPGENLAYLLRYDSVYGPSPFDLKWDQEFFIGDRSIEVFREGEPLKLPWASLGVDIVLECSGQFTHFEKAAQHLQAGAKKVLLSTTGAEDIPLLIYGHHKPSAAKDLSILSPGGCMTNCCTHLVHLPGPHIESVAIHVIHSYTSRQELVDAPHRDFRRGRAAAESIIPVPVDLGQSLERLFPHLKNSITAMTTRVPVANGALADFSFVLKEETTREKINAWFQQAVCTSYKGILQYTEEPLVSLDVKGNAHSAVILGDLTSVVGRQVKVFALFDNEWGYTGRMIDWMKMMLI